MSLFLRKVAIITAGFIATSTATTATATATETPTFNLSTNQLKVAELEPGQSARFAKGEVAEVLFAGSEVRSTEATLTTMAAVPAPNCIVARAEKGFVQVYNNCGGSDPQRVKVVLAFGLDTQCKSIQPGTRTNIGVATGRIDGVFLC
ncbi:MULTISPECIES: hypothetical protein [Corynebacterium]|jgi:hypothetical protein cresD4_09294|nr:MULTISPECIES: hypothetical protein [Corynebacterium]MCG7243187.1 hypothetical protein [Corynebacterium sp. ACRPS]MCG7271215.1 hypothetical protein [Corynebacterium sp. ACRQM]MCG7233671.1 hypothetical protein [Corynebacterium sp. ACRPR]MDK8474440.1 hypothetical protein [Corynebacterium sp. MSK078]MDK8659848.1 hypothetical protein [Corynebacterium sp. MSK204]